MFYRLNYKFNILDLNMTAVNMWYLHVLSDMVANLEKKGDKHA